MLNLHPVDKGHCCSTEQKLLWNICQLLQELSEKNVIDNKNIQNLEQKECKYCGQTHENKGGILACARKYKKGSG